VTRGCSPAPLLAGDLIALIEEQAATKRDPAEREWLDREYDMALEVLERASKKAEAVLRHDLAMAKLGTWYEAKDLLESPGLRRSHLSAAEKSKVIRAFGVRRYLEIRP
jgi:hypothetical protein